MSHLPPLQHPDDIMDQYSQSDMSSTAEIRKLSLEAAKVHTKFPVTPLPVRDGESIAVVEEDDNMKVTDTLSSSWLNSSGLLSFLNHGSGSEITSNGSNSGFSRKTSRYSNDPTVASKTTFASCIVEVCDMT